MVDNVESTFINIVKITEIKDVDYIIHLVNTYTGKMWVFKIYKDLWESAMRVRSIEPLNIDITDDEEKAKEKKEKKEKEKEDKIAKVYT